MSDYFSHIAIVNSGGSKIGLSLDNVVIIEPVDENNCTMILSTGIKIAVDLGFDDAISLWNE